MHLDPDTCYQTMLSKDRRFDGWFFVGVSSTGIYCRPVCPVRPPKFENCTFFANAATGSGDSTRCVAGSQAHGRTATMTTLITGVGAVGSHVAARLQEMGEPVVVYGDGLQVRGNTYVDDCVAATVAAAGALPGEIYNIGGGEAVTVWEVLRKLEAILDCRADVRREPARLGDQRYTGADTSKLHRHLGWQPRVGLDEGLARQVAWQRRAKGA